MANGCPIKELCEETTCPICLEYFEDPVILDCGHNFCRACLTQHWKGFGMVATCPQCREKDQQRSVRPNRQLATVVELVKKLQKRKGPEGKWHMCEKHQEPLKLYCEDDRTPICVVCDRSKEHRAHTVLPVEEASQENKISCSEAGARSMAIQYLRMEMPKLLEHCQQKGLRTEGLSMEDLRILLILHARQPELESAKVKAKKIQQPEQDAQEGCDPKEMENVIQVPEKICEEPVAAQARQQKREWELLQLRKKPDKKTPKSFTPFSPGGNPISFLSNFERAAEKQRVVVEEYMVYLPPLLRGELAEFYYGLSEGGPVPYRAFKAAVSKNFHLGPDHFSQEFYTLQPQEGRSFLEFGAKLEEALNKWLDSVKAYNREKVLDVILLERFFSQLPQDIRHLVRAKAPQDVFQAAGIADQLMLNWQGSGSSPHLRRDIRGSQKGGWDEAYSEREKGSLPVEHKRAPNVAVSTNLKEKVCFKCGETGHLKASCPKLTASTCKPVYLVTAICESGKEATSGIRETLMVKDQRVVAVLSTGSTVSVVCTDLVSPSDLVPGETFLIQFITGRLSTVPVAHLPIEWKGQTILQKVGVVDGLFAQMIIGRDVLFRDNQPFEITHQSIKWLAPPSRSRQPKKQSIQKQS